MWVSRSNVGKHRQANESTLVAVFVTYTGLYVPFFYVEAYANNIGIHGSLAFYMLIILNAASVLGRIIPPFIADKYVLP